MPQQIFTLPQSACKSNEIKTPNLEYGTKEGKLVIIAKSPAELANAYDECLIKGINAHFIYISSGS